VSGKKITATSANSPLPKVIDLGFHLLRVVELPKKDFYKELDEDEPGDVRGFWDPDEDLIVIGKWLPRKEKRQILLHELIHAIIDLRDRYDEI